MYTILFDPKHGQLRFDTQQYEIGTYVIINNNTKYQGAVDKKEIDYHISIRKKCIKKGGYIIEGNIIENYKGKFPINNFKKDKK